VWPWGVMAVPGPSLPGPPPFVLGSGIWEHSITAWKRPARSCSEHPLSSTVLMELCPLVYVEQVYWNPSRVGDSSTSLGSRLLLLTWDARAWGQGRARGLGGLVGYGTIGASTDSLPPFCFMLVPEHSSGAFFCPGARSLSRSLVLSRGHPLPGACQSGGWS